MEKSGKSKKEAKEDKLKEQKADELLLKSLEETSGSLEEKHQLLIRKHVDSERENRRLRNELKTQTKQMEIVLREKENLQREHNKNVLIQDKLQEVCREQQKIIKCVKNEGLLKIREEEERRKESQSKFQTALNEITASLSKNADENNKLRRHNEEMTKKIKCVADQYHAREEQLEKLNEQVQLERQLNEAKLSKLKVEAAMEKEILIKEKQVIMERLLIAQQNFKDMAEREVGLKQQLTMYTEKYDVFQSSLQKSNDIFTSYKQEIDKMSKHNSKLEKELIEWKIKCERSNASVINLATDKKERDDYALRCTRQVEQLQKLLRALQHERTHLYSVLRDNQIAVPESPPLPAEPEPMKLDHGYAADKEKMELMTKNCAELKETLACLQNQIKTMSFGKTDAGQANAAAVGVQQALTDQQAYESCAQKKRQKSKRKALKLKSKDEEMETAAAGAGAGAGAVEINDNVSSCSKKNNDKKRKSKTASNKSVNNNKTEISAEIETDTVVMPKTLGKSLVNAISVAISEVTKDMRNDNNDNEATSAAASDLTVAVANDNMQQLVNGQPKLTAPVALETVIAAVLQKEQEQENATAVVDAVSEQIVPDVTVAVETPAAAANVENATVSH